MRNGRMGNTAPRGWKAPDDSDVMAGRRGDD
jgi:hypothetical protein